MEKTDYKIIFGAPTTLAVNGLMMMMINKVDRSNAYDAQIPSVNDADVFSLPTSHFTTKLSLTGYTLKIKKKLVVRKHLQMPMCNAWTET